VNRDLQLAVGAAAVTLVPGIGLWLVGAPSVPALLASLAVAVIVILALGRRWYRQVVARIDAQTVHL
jgi:membrane protein implicated in regulation of membrane protease activity